MRALVVVCRYLGDVLLATPLARSLHHAGYSVDWLVAPGTDSIIHNQPFAQHIYTLTPSIAGAYAAIQQLNHRYDKAFVINGADRPMLVSLFCAKQVYALVPARKQDAWKRWFTTAYITNTATDHMVHYAIDIAALANIQPCYQVGIEWSEKDQLAVAQQVPTSILKSFVHLHPFARWRYKYWPDRYWQILARKILHHGSNIVLTAAPHERNLAEALMNDPLIDSNRVCILAGELTWSQLAYLTHQARAYIGLDTANTHLAASTGTPTLAIFGPTNPIYWGPWPYGYHHKSPYTPSSHSGIQSINNVTLIQGRQACVPCQLEGCDRHSESNSTCLEDIDPERVWQALLPHIA
ncbi:MAG: glycosyltransferase family 9 protein [Zetaproteobacteria bacterium]|nr:glycosyltransferase family 9 protein [Zetaproteobacteria bacterium]